MRIALVVAGQYPALRGSQVLVRQLAGGLRARGHGVDVVTDGGGPAVRGGPRIARLVWDARLLVRLWLRVRRGDVDVIHAHNYEAAIAGLLVAQLTGRPLVYHGHSALAEELPMYVCRRWARRGMRWLGHLLDTQVPRRADFCIAVTEELGHVLRGRGVTASALECITPTGSAEEMGPEPTAYAGTDATALVCYAGNLDGYQNLAFLLAAFEQVRASVPRARLVLVTHEARTVVTVPGVDVVRAASYHEVRQRLETAHVAVCPRVEPSGFPMKLLNYMAAGKAIVASAGSAKGLADGVTGRVVPDGDVAGFAAAIVSLLGDERGRARLGAAARRAVEDPRASEATLDRIEGIYRRVASRAQSSVQAVTVTE